MAHDDPFAKTRVPDIPQPMATALLPGAVEFSNKQISMFVTPKELLSAVDEWLLQNRENQPPFAIDSEYVVGLKQMRSRLNQVPESLQELHLYLVMRNADGCISVVNSSYDLNCCWDFREDLYYHINKTTKR